ncbi:hypothetical protein [Hyphomicrobium sp.]|uniref:hypothetical protein n=1 Tax=Hyphomicrobium sp. TaxID=82 RepID=UPI0025BC01DF|nr:hypothetical protein [Hyphomicrobium sp.]MCC7252839.1 hypothetical protein [Hyphomicrobium sp.]
MTKAYTDNTNASDPPGGKRHNPAFHPDSKLPPEQGLEPPRPRKRKPASGARRAAKSKR